MDSGQKECILQEKTLAQAMGRRMGKCHAVQKAIGKIIDSNMSHGQGSAIDKDENEAGVRRWRFMNLKLMILESVVGRCSVLEILI